MNSEYEYDDGYDSITWGDIARSESDDYEDDYEEYEGDCEPHGSYDLSDDAYALASAGWGTDEDYGFFGGDDY